MSSGAKAQGMTECKGLVPSGTPFVFHEFLSKTRLSHHLLFKPMYLLLRAIQSQFRVQEGSCLSSTVLGALNLEKNYNPNP